MLTANSAMLEGNSNGFIWRVRGSYKNAASYKTPKEYVYNSGFNEQNYSALLGLNKKWGYTHLHLSRYDAFIGSIEGEKDSITNRFIDINGNIMPDNILRGRKLEIPFQNVDHIKISSVSNIVIGNSQLKFNAGYQVNNRKEYGVSSDLASLFFHLNTITYDIKYILPINENIETAYGMSGMTQKNENRGFEFLIPDYFLQDAGGFAYIKASIKRFTFNGGIRFDYRFVNSKQLIVDSNGVAANIGDTVFHAFNSKFNAFSGSVGMTYKISKYFNLKINIGRGYRAPNIAELGSNGVHEGTFRYEIGNSNLKPETSIQFDSEIRCDTKFLSATIGGFYNLISNYIYQRNINNETKNVEGKDYQVFRFVQGNSVLTGFEANIDIHPIDQLHFDNSFSYVLGTNISTEIPLPFIPAPHSLHELQWTFKTPAKNILKQPYIKIGIGIHLDQNRFDEFETKTDGYTLLSAGIGTNIKIKNQQLIFFISVDNLTNVEYYDHLSRLKEAGIFNMGRNITFGLIVPFGIKKSY
jgi:iron complex outermembrane receptor protein